MNFYPGLSSAERAQAAQLANETGLGSMFMGLFDKNRPDIPIDKINKSNYYRMKSKTGPFLREKIVRPFIEADMRLGKGIIGSIKNPSRGLGGFLSRAFTQKIPFNVGGEAFINKQVPLASAPLAKARGIALPTFAMIGSISLMNALQKRKERKEQERMVENMQGGQYGQ